MGAGKKTSSELPDDLWAAWKESGASIPVLLREALESRRLLPDPDEHMRSLVREAVAAEMDARGLTADALQRKAIQEARSAPQQARARVWP